MGVRIESDREHQVLTPRKKKPKQDIKDNPSNPSKRILGQRSATYFVPVPFLLTTLNENNNKEKIII